MIKIVAKNTVNEGMRDEFINRSKELIHMSQKEEGCISYDLYEDINDPNVLTFIESWADKESIYKHNESDHFKAIVPTLGQLVKDPDVRLYTIAK